MRGSRGADTDLFSFMTSDRIQGNGMRLSQERLGWPLGKTFFTQRLVGHWHRLPREAVTAPILSEFKMILDNSLGTLGLSCARPGVGLNDSGASLPIPHIL